MEGVLRFLLLQWFAFCFSVIESEDFEEEEDEDEEDVVAEEDDDDDDSEEDEVSQTACLLSSWNGEAFVQTNAVKVKRKLLKPGESGV